MLTSINPKGEVEVYTDIGQYIGVLPPEFASEFATDGGPGSGNFGHKGRPGKVGGSGPGGGKQYRGGRADIGYFGSRKDWLNGLNGEKQAGATRVLKSHGERLKHQLRAKELIEKRWKQGLITESEKEEALKNGNLDKIREGMSAEEYVMKTGSNEDKNQLLGYVSEARKWDDNKDRLMKENLSEDERKVFDYLWNNYEDLEGTETDVFFDLYAKAMDVPTSGEEIPDEVLYAAGVKERPVTKPQGPDYSWVANNPDVGQASYYMKTAIGEVAPYSERMTPESFGELNQRFVDKMKHEIVSPTEANYYGIQAIKRIRGQLAPRDPASSWAHLNYKYGPENFDRLTDDEKKRLLEVVNAYISRDSFTIDLKDNVDDLTFDDFQKVERKMKEFTPRKKEERRMIQDYILLQDKMLTGAEPVSEDEVEAKKKAEAEKKAQAEAAEKAKKEAERNAKSSVWKSKHSPEEIKKMYSPDTVAGVKKGDEMDLYSADNSSANPDRAKHVKEQRGNCQTCVVAYELRRRGYDVIAKPRKGDAEAWQYELAATHRTGASAWIDPETGEPPEKIRPETGKKWNKNNVAKWLDKQVQDGQRFTMSVCWKRGGAHIVCLERENGHLMLVDPQNGEKQLGIEKIAEYLADCKLNTDNDYSWNPTIMRVDNALPNKEYYDNILLPAKQR